MKKNTLQKVNKFAVIAVLLAFLSITISPASGSGDEGDLLIPSRGYSVDYYRGYGEPAIKVSIIGDTEFERGESADIQIKIANAGVINGFKRLYVNQDLIPDSKEELIALAEMKAEQDCTIAKGVKANLTSESDYIQVEPSTSLQTVDKLETGYMQTLKYTINIDSTAPAGDYELKLPVTYEYQSNALTETSTVTNLGIFEPGYTKEYSVKDIVLPVNISIKKEPMFEVSNVSGSLMQGSENTVNITYTNTGEVAAEDAEVKFIAIKPLSTSNTVLRLGTIEPAESKVASLKISADSGALVKNYTIDSEIKYIDDSGKTMLSDNMKVDVPVKQAESRIGIIAIVGILLALVFIYQGIKVLRNRKKNSDNDSGDKND